MIVKDVWKFKKNFKIENKFIIKNYNKIIIKNCKLFIHSWSIQYKISGKYGFASIYAFFVEIFQSFCINVTEFP